MKTAEQWCVFPLLNLKTIKFNVAMNKDENEQN